MTKFRRWSTKKAHLWYSSQPWLFGSNYTPATAVNQLEMWQAETFDLARIDQELAWARGLGMNTMRVFLHDLLWIQDASGFTKRVDEFLRVASSHGIRPMLVLFDSCWHPEPKLGPQPGPLPGIHNSGWVQGPGRSVLEDPAPHMERLEAYVTGIVAAFGQDKRVLAWDIWNEPCNANVASYATSELVGKTRFVAPLLIKAFEWARNARPSQPLTSGLWVGDWSSRASMNPIHRIQAAQSDVISFHNYGDAKDFEKRAGQLQRYGRPLLCTEFMARSEGNTFEVILPFVKANKIAAFNWGFVQGRTQTHLPWDSWQTPYVEGDAPLWFHVILYPDGRPYSEQEAAFIKQISSSLDSLHP
ncbi:MAG: cellulase family glycosylhydrolase [Pseudomonadota bacterium]|nr:cellulase family glycosylhydrolase [Pseudomonadota bacterium]